MTEGPSAEQVLLHAQASGHIGKGEYKHAIPLLLSCQQKAKDNPSSFFVNVEQMLCMCHSRLKDHSSALEHAKRGLQLLKKLPRSGAASVASELNQKEGMEYLYLKQFENAARSFTEAKLILEKECETGSRMYGVILRSFGRLEFDQGHAQSAMEWFAKSHKVFLLLPEESEELSILLNLMSSCARALGDMTKAFSLLEDALELKKKVVGPNHPAYAVLLQNMGTFMTDVRRYDEAIGFLAKADAIFKQCYGDAGVVTLQNAQLLKRAREGLLDPSSATNHSESHRMCAKCKKLGEKLLMCSSCGRVNYCSRDCQVADWALHKSKCAEWRVAAKPVARPRGDQDQEGVFSKAEQSYKKGAFGEALELLKSIERRDELSVELAFNVETREGDCLSALGKKEEALLKKRKACKMAEASFGKDSVMFVNRLAVIAHELRDMKQWASSIATYSEALEIAKRNNFVESSLFGDCLLGRGRLDMERGQFLEAMAWFRRANAVLSKHQNETYSVLVNNMSVCSRRLGDFDAAVSLGLEALQLKLKFHGDRHPAYGAVLFNLGCAYFEMKRFDEAIPRLEAALNIDRDSYGEKHQITTECMKLLQYAREGLKDPSNARVKELVSDQRICAVCNKIATGLEKCRGCHRIYYCSIECHNADWERHEPQCEEWKRKFGCALCGAIDGKFDNGKLKQCSGCSKVLYCSPDCQRRHWDAHKADCRNSRAENAADKK